MKTDTPEQKQLQGLIAEYQNTGDAIETHKAEIEQLKQTIAAAESNSTNDLDTIARTVVDAKREIEVLQFKIESLGKRKTSLETEQFWKLEPKPSEPPEIRQAKDLIAPPVLNHWALRAVG